MNPPVIYIGQDEQLTVYFSRMLEDILWGDLFVLKNREQAAQWLISHPEEKFAIVLYERHTPDSDMGDIQYLRRNFPYVYILLITSDLTSDERLQYIRSGVNDTFPPTIKAETLQQFFHFIRKYYPELQRKRGSQKAAVTSYKMPLTKRIFDITISLLAFVLLSPLMIILSLAIRMESKGPIFYKSKRVGSNYRIFDFWKFRSMYMDADKRLKDMQKFNQYATDSSETEQHVPSPVVSNNHPTEQPDQTFLVGDDSIVPEKEYISKNRQKSGNAFIKIERDPRITKVGHFIRKYSLDELPQLFNILKGDMSVVGNRPLPLYEAELLTQDRSIERFIAPAGLTGLWQVEKRGDPGKLSAEARKQLDIYYAQHYSVWLDIQIIFRTFTAFIQKEDV